MTGTAMPLVSILDADVSVRRALARLLRSSAFDVETFSSADAFFESGGAERSACLIVDETLDDCTGLQMLDQLVATASSVPPFIFTSLSEGEDFRNRIAALGALACFQKPIEGDALLDALNLAVGRDFSAS